LKMTGSNQAGSAAARLEQEQTMKVKEWMTSKPVAVTEDDTVASVVRRMLSAGFRHMPVTKDRRLVGIVTDRDIRRVLPSIEAGATPEQYRTFMQGTRIGEVMTSDPVTCTPDTDMREAVRIFVENKYGAIPVVRGGRLVAIVSQIDAMRALLRLLESK
jgi:acetoin utilization protein AcuB